MSTTTAPLARTAPTYPADAVSAVLRDELLRAVRRRYLRKGEPLPKNDDDIVVLMIEIDSLTVVELLANLDDVLPFKVTECVVKAGGYDSIGAAVKHVTARVATQWNKHHGGAKS
jgi:hypothetical protein